MQVRVSGKNMDVGASLKSHVDARIEAGVSKYLDRVVDVAVVFHKENHLVVTDITLNTGTHAHMVVKSTAGHDDAYKSFDAAADRIEKQLRRYKRRLKGHDKPKQESNKIKLAEVTQHVFSGHEEEAHDDTPLVIAELPMDLLHLTVSEAVMKLDLEDLPVLLFINNGSDSLNAVYRRPDGNIAWIDPSMVVNSMRKAG
ncbi:ribosome-associated translation inhibitor RaiA [bacterium]|nr:ribosome-associated translation inhibitor RaiA [bacterium]